MSEHLSAADPCAREPIHIPGAIQPHGAMLCLARDDGRLLHASTNIVALLGLDMPDILAAIDPAEWLKDSQTNLSRIVKMPTGRFQISGHQTTQGLLLELEPVGETSDQSYEALRQFVERTDKLTTVRDIAAAAVQHVRAMTGFDRVLLYRFGDDWAGTVIAQDGNGTLPSYLDLRFPASDIPAQARALYTRNRSRIIPNADYQPVPITPPVSPINAEPLDLSAISLRSVSPVHLRYMQNMGTAASMSISLIADGRLWGLIACHHATSRMVDPSVRSACEFVAQIVIQQIIARERIIEIARRVALQQLENGLLVDLARSKSFQDGLIENPDRWMALANATGAALVFAGQVYSAGAAPSSRRIKDLAEWLQAGPNRPVFVTDALPTVWPEAADIAHDASGVLAVSISQLHPGYIMWFRAELRHTVSWAGDPRKPDDAQTLEPRASFAQWQEHVRYTAEPWRQAEIETAANFRNAVVDFVLRRAEERAAMTEKLQLSNKELEAFSYSVSHDLRAPFRHIVGYAELLRDREEKLDSTSRRYLDTIRDAALSAGRLVDDLLAFSHLSRVNLNKTRLDMNKLAAECWATVTLGIGQRQINWRVGQLPEAWGDTTVVRQALINLLSNAVKYTGKRSVAEVYMDGVETDAETIYSIRDNGIGFDMIYVGKLFGVFQRLHRAEDFEGTGIGLALTKRVIDRHGGWIKAEAEIDQGSVFTFSLPRRSMENLFD